MVLGIFALLLGIGAVAAALRRRRDRERYPETYSGTGGVFYTAVQIGCGAVFFLAGAGLIALAVIYRH